MRIPMPYSQIYSQQVPGVLVTNVLKESSGRFTSDFGIPTQSPGDTETSSREYHEEINEFFKSRQSADEADGLFF